MKIWAINWASIDDADCLRDDGGIDAELLAQPNGVLMSTINETKLQALIDADREGMYDEGEEPDDTLVLTRSTDDTREYNYGDTFVVCLLKEVM